MSKVEIEVELANGAGFTYKPREMSLVGLDAQSALDELDRGYKMVRNWLESMMPPQAKAGKLPEPERRSDPQRRFM